MHCCLASGLQSILMILLTPLSFYFSNGSLYLFSIFPLCIPISSVPLSLSVTICEGLRWIADPFALITRPSWPQDRCEVFSSLCWSSELQSVTHTSLGVFGSHLSLLNQCSLHLATIQTMSTVVGCMLLLSSLLWHISKTSVIKMPKPSKPCLSFSP